MSKELNLQLFARPCQLNCQEACQIRCQVCKSYCESHCMTDCQSACQCGTEWCKTNCELGCQLNCEKACQTTCERSCQVGCQVNCEEQCKKSCQSTCQLNCQCLGEGCESCQCVEEGCESCQCREEGCESCQCREEGCESCQSYCERNCECSEEGCKSCQSYCERNCQCSTQGCQDTCQKNCQSACQTGCQTTCELECQCSAQGCQSAQATDVEVNVTSSNQGVNVSINDLEHPASDYDEFVIKIIKNGVVVKTETFTNSSSSHSISRNITGLDGGSYTIKVEVKWHNKWYGATEQHAEVLTSTFSISNVTKNSFTVNISDLQYQANQYDSFKIEYNGSSKTFTSSSSSNNISHTVSGLLQDHEYTVEVKGQYNGTWYSADKGNPQKTVTTKYVDLNIRSISNETCYTGSTCRVDVVVENNGTDASDSTVLYIGIANINSQTLDTFDDYTIGSLSPGEQATKTFSVRSYSSGSKQYGCIVDKDKTQGEPSSKTSNNFESFFINWQKRQTGGTYPSVSVPSKYHEYLKYGVYGINPGSGNYSETFTDMSAVSPGFKTNITRTYNSKDSRTTKRPFGKGWSFGFEGFLDIEDGVVTMPNGSIQTFTKNGDTYSPKDSRNTLVKNPDGTFTLQTKDHYIYRFNNTGHMYQMTDKNGNSIYIELTSDGKITGIKDQADSHYTVSYNASNLINKIVEDKTSREVVYEYTNQKLTSVKSTTGYYQRYEYDTESYLSKIKDHDNNVLTVINYNHSSSEYQHTVNTITDKYGNVRTYSYNKEQKKTTIIDTNDRATIKWYDDTNSIIKIQYPDSSIETYEYFLDGNKNKYSEIKSKTDKKSNKTTYQRDSNGNITKQINPNGSFALYEYDNKNNLVKQIDEDGKATYYIYDQEKANIIKKAQPLNTTDEYTSANEANFAVTTYEYYSDAEAQNLGYKEKKLLKSLTDPDGSKITYTYDSQGNRKTATDADSNQISFEYDAIGRNTAKISPKGVRTEYVYNNKGSLLKETIKYGEDSSVKLYEYDKHERKTKEISPNIYKPAYETTDHKYSQEVGQRYEFNANGTLKKEISSEGDITKYTYNLYGNILTKEIPSAGIYEYEYDLANRVKKVFFKEEVASNKQLLEEYIYEVLVDKTEQITHKTYINQTEYTSITKTYDYANRLIKTKYADGGIETKEYNNNGTLKHSTDKNNKTTYFKYDRLNRLTEVYTPIKEVDGEVKYSYVEKEYNKDSSIAKEKFGKELVNYPTKPNSYIIKTKEYYNNGKLKKETTSGGQSVEYWYDNDLNLIKSSTKISENKHSIVEFEYNYLNKVTKKKQHVEKGDIYPNTFDSNEKLILATSYEYDNNGNITKQINPKGVATTYIYDTLDRLLNEAIASRDEFDNEVNITKSTTYNFQDSPLTKTDGNGNTKTHEYNKRGQLIKTTDALGAITAYYYDLASRLTATVSANNYKEETLLADMNRLEYKYDNMNNQIASIAVFKEKKLSEGSWVETWMSNIQKAYKYDIMGRKIKEIDANSYEEAEGTTLAEKIDNALDIEYQYNLRGDLEVVLDKATKKAGHSYNEKHDYDAFARKISEQKINGLKLEYHYDDNNNLIKKIDASNQEQKIALETNTYDLVGNVLTKTDANGNVTTFEYNLLGKMKKEIHPSDTSIERYTAYYQYDELENLVSKKDNLQKQTIIEYDTIGRVIKEINQKIGAKEVIAITKKYDKNSNIRFISDPNGTITLKTYDKLNRVITESITVNKGQDNEIEHKKTYEYDKNSNQTKVTDHNDNTVTKTYDAINRLIEIKDQHEVAIEKLEYTKTNKQSKSYDANNNVISFEYDDNERLIKTTDQEGNIERQEYDLVGNIIKKIDPLGNTTNFTYDTFNRLKTVKNALDEITSYEYDSNSNLLSITDAKGHVSSTEYNARNLPTKRIDHGGKTSTTEYDNTKLETYSYYANGALKTKTDRNQSTTSFIYDIHGRVLSEVTGDITIRFTYDNNGNILTTTDETGTTTRTYDEQNRIKIENSPNFGQTTHKYDIINSELSGQVKEITIDPLGNTTYKVYDKTNRISKVSSDSKLTTHEYNPNGSLKKIRYQNGVSQEYTYYKNNKLKTLTNKKSDGSVIDTYSYTYDMAGNMTSVIDKKGQTSYEYDKLNRIKKATKPSGNITNYEYDSAGNRTKKIISANSQITTISYTYNEQNRLVSKSTNLPDSSVQEVTYTYDNNGNMIKETIADDSKVHEYDKLNRNIKTEYKGKISNFKYNFEGKRVEKEVDGNKRRYLYEGSKVILETDENGNKLSKNVYGIRLIQRTIEDDIVNYLYNGHGDVTSLINQSEDITDTYYFDEFGNHEEKTGNTHNPYRYAGYVYDEETDLYYLNARYYDSDIARFTSEDTYRGDIKDPLSLNLYTYVSNNPLIYTDPTGHVKVDLEEDYVMNLKKKALKYGSKGAGVREVQARLKNLGYDIDVDGSFGKQTKKVVEQFQKDYNLKVDGKVGPQTYGKLIKLRGKLEVNASTNTGGSKKDSDAVGDGPKVDVDIELETTLRNEQNLRREIKEKEELFVRRGAYKAERELAERYKVAEVIEEENEGPGFWRRASAVGMGTVKAGFGILTIYGSGITAIATAGVSTPGAIVTATYGANTTISGVADIYNATFGDYDKVGDVNILKDSAEYATGEIAEVFTDDKHKIDTTKLVTGLCIDILDIYVCGKGVYQGSKKVLNFTNKFITADTYILGKISTTVPQVNKLAKTIAGSDVVFNLYSIYKNSKDNLDNLLNFLNTNKGYSYQIICD
ncbi:peptidoglycan-binding protein [Clostridiaceae bacterium M8S5]|nr:peptidoglycan-binding protein [Clostridiaceae bacterium M8S5]